MYLALKYSHINGNIIILQLLIKFVYVIMTLMQKNNSRNGRHYNSENLSVSFVSPQNLLPGSTIIHEKQY